MLFTGIVQEIGEVSFFTSSDCKKEKSMSLGIHTSEAFVCDLSLGDSIAVNGVCLTVVSFEEYGLITVDLISETLLRTNLKYLSEGSFVNLERSLKYGGEIGGHLLSGHVFDCGEIVRIISNSFYIRLDESLTKYFFDKGFIAVDGISLTIVSVTSNEVRVDLIPETLERTVIKYCQIGDKVNIEIDHATKVQVDTIERLLLGSNG